MTAPPPDARMDRDDLQLSLVLNGGVSLAVWMSGAVLELDRARCADPAAGPGAPALDRVVGAMLALTERRVVIDLIAGTSAGGINGALLAAAIANGRRLERELLLDTWLEVGAIGGLLRSTAEAEPPSLLRGDDVLRPELARALRRIAGGGEAAGEGTPTSVSLILTGTDLEGIPREVERGDGTSYREHRIHQRFCEPLRPEWGALTAGAGRDADEVLADVALAGRTSASFPGAFETSALASPAWVRGAGGEPIAGEGAPAPPPVRRAMDGGVLDNSPFEPMLRQIDRNPTGADLDRTFVFVTPYDDEPRTLPRDGALAPSAPADPGLLDAVGWTSALKGEMAGLLNLTRFSEQTRRHRESRRVGVVRALLASADPGDLLASARTMLPAYRDMRRRSALGALADEHAAAPGPSRWLPSALEGSRDPWSWGAAPVRRAGAFAVDAIAEARGGLGHRTSQERRLRARLLDAERAARAALSELSDAERRRTGAFDADPRRRGPAPAMAEALDDSWTDDERRSRGARFDAILDALLSAREALEGAPGLDPADRARATGALGVPAGLARDALGDLLLAAEVVLETGERGESTGAEVGPRLSLVALRGGTPDAGRPQLWLQHAFGDGTVRTKDVLLGMSLAHFGGFLFRSWRANDWMFGRLHAAEAIARTLLSEERLGELAAAGAGERLGAAADALADAVTDGLEADPDAAARLGALLGAGPSPGALRDAARALVDEALDPEAGPAAIERLRAVATWRMQLEVVRTELPRIWAEMERDRRVGARLPLAVPSARIGSRRLTGKSNSEWVALVAGAGEGPLAPDAALRAFAAYDLPRVAGLARQWLSAPMVGLIGRTVFVLRATLARPVRPDTPPTPVVAARRPLRGALRVVRAWSSVPVWVAAGLWRAAAPAALRSFLAVALVAYLLARPAADAATVLGAVAAALVGLPWLAGLGAATFSSTAALAGRLARACGPLAAGAAGAVAGIAARRAWGIDEPAAGLVLLVAWLAAQGAMGWLEDTIGIDPPPRGRGE